METGEIIFLVIAAVMVLGSILAPEEIEPHPDPECRAMLEEAEAYAKMRRREAWMRRLRWLIGPEPGMGEMDMRWWARIHRFVKFFPEGPSAHYRRYFGIYGWGMTEEKWEQAEYRVDSASWTGRDGA